MSDWSKFAWSSFLFGGIGADRDYQSLIGNISLVQQLRQAPHSLTTTDIQRFIITEFLNRWKCRFQNTSQAAEDIKSCLIQLHPYIQALTTMTIRDTFSKMVSVTKTERTDLGHVIEMAYSKINGSAKGLGPTISSKLLHVLRPEVFIMWDAPIIEHYHVVDKRVSASAQGYLHFHHLMRDIVKRVDISFASEFPQLQVGGSQFFEAYLSTQLGYAPAKTAAKVVDEFNWVTITNGVIVPPRWHP